MLPSFNPEDMQYSRSYTLIVQLILTYSPWYLVNGLLYGVSSQQIVLNWDVWLCVTMECL